MIRPGRGAAEKGGGLGAAAMIAWGLTSVCIVQRVAAAVLVGWGARIRTTGGTPGYPQHLGVTPTPWVYPQLCVS